MSGGSPTPTPTPTPSCKDVRHAPISSPNPAAIASLKVGDRLDVVLAKSVGRAILQLQDFNGAVIGSLTFLGHLKLIECMEMGFTYKAVVLSISGGAVQVRIEPT